MRDIYQMEPQTLLFRFRSPGRDRWLLSDIAPGRQRIHPVSGKPGPARTPGGFCMLLRKHLEGTICLGLKQPFLERSLILTFGLGGADSNQAEAPSTRVPAVLAIDEPVPGAKVEAPSTRTPAVLAIDEPVPGAKVEAPSTRTPAVLAIDEPVTGAKVETPSSRAPVVLHHLAFEMTGRFANLVLLDREGLVIGQMKLPGANSPLSDRLARGTLYQPAGRFDPGETTSPGRTAPAALIADGIGKVASPAQGARMMSVALETGDPPRELSRQVFGLSPIYAAELLAPFLAADSGRRMGTDSDWDRMKNESRAEAWSEFWERALNRPVEPRVIYNEENAPEHTFMLNQAAPLALTVWPFIIHRGRPAREFATISEAVEAYYANLAGAHWEKRRDEQRARVRQLLVRLGKNRHKVEQDRIRLGEPALWRKCADLILAQLHLIPRGAGAVELDDYFSTPPVKINITMDPARSAQDNAQLYYRKHKKAARGLQHQERRLAGLDAEISYLEHLALSIDQAQSEDEWDALLPELERLGQGRPKAGEKAYAGSRSGKGAKASGLIPGKPGGKADGKAGGKPAGKAGGKTAARTGGKSAGEPRQFTAEDGDRLLVGRNNRQNEELSLRRRRPGDIWFHVHQLPGAHVILRPAPGSPVPEGERLARAARAAAHFSRCAPNTWVEVDYARAESVRKVPGGRPGMVTCRVFGSLRVEPSLEEWKESL